MWSSSKHVALLFTPLALRLLNCSNYLVEHLDKTCHYLVYLFFCF